MGWWKADPVPDTPSPSTSLPPHPISSQAPDASTSSCPVDPNTRAIWLAQAQTQKKQSESQPHPQSPTNEQTHPESQLPPSHPPLPQPLPNPTTYGSSQECSSDRISQSPPSTPTTSTSSYPSSRPLSHDRVISTIPRALPSTPSLSSPSSPANSESETGTSSTGNWIYPSESQFFHAVMRKQATATSPQDLASSVSAIIPIHNAVNERAWTLIKAWEGNTSSHCGGPKLLSFKGLGAGAISPKARMKTLMGYTEPFDRHDWVVERCDGEKVEYVIDFYQGKAEPGTKGSTLNFYLDVRPKLNSWEGCRMRAEKLVGWR